MCRGLRKSTDQMPRSVLFQRYGDTGLIPGDYCRRHTGFAEMRMAKKDNNKVNE